MPPDPATDAGRWPARIGGSPCRATRGKHRTYIAETNAQGYYIRRYHRNSTRRLRIATVAELSGIAVPREAVASPSNTRHPPTLNVTCNSPGRRTTPHITPDELRRELSGTFPAPATTANPRRNSSSRRANASQSDRRGQRRSRTSKADALSPTLPLTLPTTNSGERITTRIAKPLRRPRNRKLRSPTTTERRSVKRPNPFGASPSFAFCLWHACHSLRMPFRILRRHRPRKLRAAKKRSAKRCKSPAAAIRTCWLPTKRRSSPSISAARSKFWSAAKPCIAFVCRTKAICRPRESSRPFALPAGAEVMNTTATQGIVQPSQDAQSKGQLQWQIARLIATPAKRSKSGSIPRESRPLELGVSWTRRARWLAGRCRSAGSRSCNSKSPARAKCCSTSRRSSNSRLTTPARALPKT